MTDYEDDGVEANEPQLPHEVFKSHLIQPFLATRDVMRREIALRAMNTETSSASDLRRPDHRLRWYVENILPVLRDQGVSEADVEWSKLMENELVSEFIKARKEGEMNPLKRLREKKERRLSRDPQGRRCR